MEERGRIGQKYMVLPFSNTNYLLNLQPFSSEEIFFSIRGLVYSVIPNNLDFKHYCLPLNTRIQLAPRTPSDEKISVCPTSYIQNLLPPFV